MKKSFFDGIEKPFLGHIDSKMYISCKVESWQKDISKHDYIKIKKFVHNIWWSIESKYVSMIDNKIDNFTNPLNDWYANQNSLIPNINRRSMRDSTSRGLGGLEFFD